MKTILKIALLLIALLVAGSVAMAVIGIVYKILIYAVIVGVLGGVGYAGYKLFKKEAALELGSNDSVAQIEIDNLKSVKELEEYKRRYLK